MELALIQYVYERNFYVSLFQELKDIIRYLDPNIGL